MNNNLKYSIQIITDADKLTEALHLRYNIYKTAFPLLTAHHNEPYEWNEFDARSIHLGLHCSNEREETLAGYCRLIIPESCAHKLSSLIPTAFPSFVNKSVIAKEKLAFIKQMHKSKEADEIDSFCNELENEK